MLKFMTSAVDWTRFGSKTSSSESLDAMEDSSSSSSASAGGRWLPVLPLPPLPPLPPLLGGAPLPLTPTETPLVALVDLVTRLVAVFGALVPPAGGARVWELERERLLLRAGIFGGLEIEEILFG